ncbi:5'-nucleotidase, lipoprotein e(P4) family [Ancylomarina longa]|uniref:5'-nucleotidase, lipoprotein e(P4) family n=1 Tax=Ancylomarina longa TaxID=2487017 RepID=A0A434AWD2_9BACT|nr:5'-nucleotidase, lipoprotein e(P4) family [Ancylomarina longa]RUT78815.1 5'-nucleotidase, lipoprotein e(P4) family [Ancylomarina longa]
MKKIFFSLSIFAIVFSSCSNCTTTKTTRTNPNEHLVMSTLWYQRASECRALYYQAFNIAKVSLDNYMETKQGNKPLAVVVDIDETVLDNSPFETNSIRSEKNFSSQAWKEWTDKAKAGATPGSLEFLKYAANNGVETFYISNRDTSATKSTLSNLKKLGFPYADFQHLLLKTNTSLKTTRRNKVMKTHNIVLLAGDNMGDFDGLFEDRSNNFGFVQVDSLKDLFGKRFIILPNPMYGSWERQVLKSNQKLNNSEKEELRKKQLIGYEEL